MHRTPPEFKSEMSPPEQTCSFSYRTSLPYSRGEKGSKCCTIKLAVYDNVLKRQGALYELRYSWVHMAMRPTISIYVGSSLPKCDAQELGKWFQTFRKDVSALISSSDTLQ